MFIYVHMTTSFVQLIFFADWDTEYICLPGFNCLAIGNHSRCNISSWNFWNVSSCKVLDVLVFNTVLLRGNAAELELRTLNWSTAGWKDKLRALNTGELFESLLVNRRERPDGLILEDGLNVLNWILTYLSRIPSHSLFVVKMQHGLNALDLSWNVVVPSHLFLLLPIIIDADSLWLHCLLHIK